MSQSNRRILRGLKTRKSRERASEERQKMPTDFLAVLQNLDEAVAFDIGRKRPMAGFQVSLHLQFGVDERDDLCDCVRHRLRTLSGRYWSLASFERRLRLRWLRTSDRIVVSAVDVIASGAAPLAALNKQI